MTHWVRRWLDSPCALSRSEAVTALLAQPDEPGLSRGYHYTLPRASWLDPETAARNLATAHLAHRQQAHRDISAVVSVRRDGRLRMARRA